MSEEDIPESTKTEDKEYSSEANTEEEVKDEISEAIDDGATEKDSKKRV